MISSLAASTMSDISEFEASTTLGSTDLKHRLDASRTLDRLEYMIRRRFVTCRWAVGSQRSLVRRANLLRNGQPLRMTQGLLRSGIP